MTDQLQDQNDSEETKSFVIASYWVQPRSERKESRSIVALSLPYIDIGHAWANLRAFPFWYGFVNRIFVCGVSLCIFLSLLVGLLSSRLDAQNFNLGPSKKTTY